MSEKPILFSGPMVRAILEGRKTQTRRVVKCAGLDLCGPCGLSGEDMRLAGRDWSGNSVLLKCPHGETGSRLWVRETFQLIPDDGGSVVYRATDPDWETTEDWTWKPSIFMPRHASRITLEITTVRVERVQDIGEVDAKAEGVEPFAPDDGCYRSGYAGLWDSINAKRGFGWESNPWVWLLEFKRV